MQWVDPDVAFLHHRCNPVRLGQGLKILPVKEFQDQSMRRLLCLEALLHPDQEIFGAFPGNLKSYSDDFEWFGLMHVFSPDRNCSTRTLSFSRALMPEGQKAGAG